VIPKNTTLFPLLCILYACERYDTGFGHGNGSAFKGRIILSARDTLKKTTSHQQECLQQQTNHWNQPLQKLRTCTMNNASEFQFVDSSIEDEYDLKCWWDDVHPQDDEQQQLLSFISNMTTSGLSSQSATIEPAHEHFEETIPTMTTTTQQQQQHVLYPSVHTDEEFSQIDTSSLSSLYDLIDETLQDCPSSLGLLWSSKNKTNTAQLTFSQPQHLTFQGQIGNVKKEKQARRVDDISLLSNLGLFETVLEQGVMNCGQSSKGTKRATDLTIQAKPSPTKRLKRRRSVESLEASTTPSPTSMFSSFSINSSEHSPAGMSMTSGGIRKKRGGYRVRFSHNHFEEMSFKQVNPSNVFYKFR